METSPGWMWVELTASFIGVVFAAWFVGSIVLVVVFGLVDGLTRRQIWREWLRCWNGLWNFDSAVRAFGARDDDQEGK